jgi:hypothetical protein
MKLAKTLPYKGDQGEIGLGFEPRRGGLLNRPAGRALWLGYGRSSGALAQIAPSGRGRQSRDATSLQTAVRP